jgi:CelD/BcsL family acetyltransferase involved in cellulose biosynthesis
MMVTQYPGYGPLRLKSLQFMGADPHLTEIRGPLLRPDLEGPALRSVVDAVQSASRTWDWVKWSGIRSGSIGENILGQASGAAVSGELCDHVVSLTPSWDEFRRGRKRNVRESIRKCYNSLARDGHAFTFRVAETPEEIEAALPHFFDLHSRRAQQADTVPHVDYFASPRARAFLTDVCVEMARTGCARVFTLLVGEAVVAARVGFVLNGSLYLYYSGYDPNWSRYSVMTTTVVEAIKYAISNGLRTVGLSTGRDVSKARWSPAEVIYNEYLQVAPTAGSALAYRTYAGVQKLRRQQFVQQLAGGRLGRRTG